MGSVVDHILGISKDTSIIKRGSIACYSVCTFTIKIFRKYFYRLYATVSYIPIVFDLLSYWFYLIFIKYQFDVKGYFALLYCL